MLHDSLDFIEEVERSAELRHLSVSELCVGEDPVVPVRLFIEKARVEITITAKRCTVKDGMGKAKSFERSLSGWDQRSLEYIEELLTAYMEFR